MALDTVEPALAILRAGVRVTSAKAAGASKSAETREATSAGVKDRMSRIVMGKMEKERGCRRRARAWMEGLERRGSLPERYEQRGLIEKACGSSRCVSLRRSDIDGGDGEVSIEGGKLVLMSIRSMMVVKR